MTDAYDKQKNEPIALDAGKAMAGVLALLVAEREERANGINGKDGPRKTEVILAAAGLSLGEIAAVTGKSPNAVWKTIAASVAGAARRPSRWSSPRSAVPGGRQRR